MTEKLLVFAKAQVSAFLGGILDYFLMIYFTEFFGMHYTISIVLGGLSGALFNFSMNRRWVFHSNKLEFHCSHRNQLLKFTLVVLNSILLKASGTYFFTSFLGIDYKISRIITDLTVSLVFNFTLQKHWVFKRARTSRYIPGD